MDVIKENKKSIIYKEIEELVDKSRKIISKEEFCKKVEEFYPEHKAKEGA